MAFGKKAELSRKALAVLRRWTLPALLLAAAQGPLAQRAFAASSDTIQLFVTPIVYYGVTISSVNERGYDFGAQGLNSVTHSTAPIVVRNTGNVTSKWQLRASNTANWSVSSSTGPDQFVLMGVFTSTASSAQVDTGEFTNGTDEILANYQSANGINNSGRYNAGVNMDVVPPAGQGNCARNLWLKLKTPDQSTTGEEQMMRLYITTTVSP